MNRQEINFIANSTSLLKRLNSIHKISIVIVREIIEEQKRLDIRLVLEVLKSAEKQKEIKSNQTTIDFSE